MTNSGSLATFATGTFSLESLKTDRRTERKATEVVHSWLPDNEAEEVLEILGITKGKKSQ